MMTDSRKRFTQIITFVSLVFFMGTMGTSVVALFSGNSRQQTVASNNSATTDPTPQLEQLKQQEEGYLTVLKREPENLTALQGLVEIRLATNNFEGAIEPIETLIALQPEDENLKTLLAEVNKLSADVKKGQSSSKVDAGD